MQWVTYTPESPAGFLNLCNGPGYAAMIEREGGQAAARQWRALEAQLAPLQAGAALFPAAAIRADIGARACLMHESTPSKLPHVAYIVCTVKFSVSECPAAFMAALQVTALLEKSHQHLLPARVPACFMITGTSSPVEQSTFTVVICLGRVIDLPGRGLQPLHTP